MKNSIITEIVKFKASETTTYEQLLIKVDILNDFQKKQDGFIDAELVIDAKEDAYYLIYHFESLEKVKVIGGKLRNSEAFEEFNSVIVPESVSITFCNKLRNW